MKVTVNNLTNIMMDWVIAALEHKEKILIDQHGDVSCWSTDAQDWCYYSPSRFWKDAGELVEKHKLSVIPSTKWLCEIQHDDGSVVSMKGETPLIAICRCLIAFKFGSDYEVEIPEGLFKGKIK